MHSNLVARLASLLLGSPGLRLHALRRSATGATQIRTIRGHGRPGDRRRGQAAALSPIAPCLSFHRFWRFGWCLFVVAVSCPLSRLVAGRSGRFRVLAPDLHPADRPRWRREQAARSSVDSCDTHVTSRTWDVRARVRWVAWRARARLELTAAPRTTDSAVNAHESKRRNERDGRHHGGTERTLYYLLFQ
jgi:hypothetical protein